MINRNNPDLNADPMTELQVGMKSDLRLLAEKMLGEEDAKLADDEGEEIPADGPATINLLEGDLPVAERSLMMANRVTQMEQTQAAILRRVEQIYEAQKGAPPPPPQ